MDDVQGIDKSRNFFFELSRALDSRCTRGKKFQFFLNHFPCRENIEEERMRELNERPNN